MDISEESVVSIDTSFIIKHIAFRFEGFVKEVSLILHEIEYNALNLPLRFKLVSFTLINQAVFQIVF